MKIKKRRYPQVLPPEKAAALAKQGAMYCPAQCSRTARPLQGGKPSRSCTHQKVPTICVEGVNNRHGSHGKMRGQLETQMKKYPSGAISYDDAIEEGVDSVKRVFPESGCSEKYLRAQLKAFYDKYKDCSPLVASDGKGGIMEVAMQMVQIVDNFSN